MAKSPRSADRQMRAKARKGHAGNALQLSGLNADTTTGIFQEAAQFIDIARLAATAALGFVIEFVSGAACGFVIGGVGQAGLCLGLCGDDAVTVEIVGDTGDENLTGGAELEAISSVLRTRASRTMSPGRWA